MEAATALMSSDVQKSCYVQKTLLDCGAFDLWMLQSFCSCLPWWSLSLEEEVWYRCYICSSTFCWYFSTFWAGVSFCGNYHPQHKQTSRKRCEHCTNHGYRDKNLEDCFNASPIWQNNGSTSLPRGHEFPSPGFLVTLTVPGMCFLLWSKVIPITIIMPLIHCHILPDHLLLGFTGYTIRLFDNIFPQKSK